VSKPRGVVIRTRQPAHPSDERVDVYESAPGSWYWVYSHDRAELSLRSNDDYSSESEAVASAHMAYPNLDPVVHRLPQPAESRSALSRGPELVKLVAMAAAAGAAVWWWRKLSSRA